jgi:O-antigen/teichoic acid export membrane protein
VSPIGAEEVTARDTVRGGTGSGTGTGTRPSPYEGVLKKDLIRGSLWTLLTAVVMVPLAFATNLVLAHELHPAGLGRLATYIVAFTLATTVINMGMSDATVQWLAEARALGAFEAERSLIRRCAGYHSFIEGPIVAGLAFWLLHGAGWPAAAVAAAAVWLTQIAGTSSVILTATARNTIVAKLTLATAMAVQVAVVATAVSRHSAPFTYAAQLTAASLAPALCLCVLSRVERQSVLRPTLRGHNPPEFARYGVSACAGALVSGLVFGRSELFVLQANGRLLAAGLFAVATGIASQITIPMDALMGPLVPTAAGLVAAAPQRALPVLQRSLRISSLLGALTAAIVVPAGYVLIPYAFGTAFTSAKDGFVALALASCLQSVIVPVSAFAFATRSAAAVLRADLACLIVDAVLAFTLIPLIGLTGAVIASAAAQVLSLLLLIRVVVGRMQISVVDVVSATRSFWWGPIGAMLAVGVVAVTNLPTAIALVVAVAIGLVSTCLVFRIGSMRLDPRELGDLMRNLPGRLHLPFRWLCQMLGCRLPNV